jgi:hypothetical protein
MSMTDDNSSNPPSSGSATTATKCHPIGIKDKVTWDIIKVITALRAKMNIFHKQFKHVHITQSKEFLSRKRNPRCY